MTTSLSADRLAMDAVRDAEQAAAVIRGKEAAAKRQADARTAHAAELAQRRAADDAMGIHRNWPEARKGAARQKHADQQRAAQMAAEREANPPKPTPRASLSQDTSPAATLLKLQRGSMQPGMPFPKG